jgi:hypothetical protein
VVLLKEWMKRTEHMPEAPQEDMDPPNQPE